MYWNPLDVVKACIGGAIIALSTSLHLYYFGRVSGISGMFYTAIRWDKQTGLYWKLSFLYGLLFLPIIFSLVCGSSSLFTIKGEEFLLFDSDDESLAFLNIGGWLVGGFLVGFGTKMGNGCTSGHGVCGIPRFSKRSIVAVCTFISSGIGIATLRYYYPFFYNGESFGDKYIMPFFGLRLAFLLLMTIAFVLFMIWTRNWEYLKCFIFGVIFGLGLLISGMCRISKIFGFLTINNSWDPSLLFVMASAVSINFFSFRYILKMKTPKEAPSFSIPNPAQNPDLKLIAGSFIFGLGWGISGLCPGPGIINMFQLTYAVFWVLALAAGQLSMEVSQTVVDRLRHKYNRLTP